MPREWAYSTARETSARMAAALGAGSLSPARLWPSTNSIAITLLVADVADLEDADDARVAQRGGGLGFAAEADELLLAAGAEEDLEGDPAAQGAFHAL